MFFDPVNPLPRDPDTPPLSEEVKKQVADAMRRVVEDAGVQILCTQTTNVSDAPASTLTLEDIRLAREIIGPPPLVVRQSPLIPSTVREQFRFPRSSSKRIKKKWAKDPKNWRDVPVAFVFDPKGNAFSRSLHRDQPPMLLVSTSHKLPCQKQS